MAETPMPAAVPTDEAIATAARAMLDAYGDTIFLSRLGQDLRTKFGPDFKRALGDRPLGDFVCQWLGDTYEVWGKGPYKRVGPHGSAAKDDSPQAPPKYLDAVWRAFGAPLAGGLKRWIELTPPLAWADAEDAVTSGAIEIPRIFIVDDAQPRRLRAAAIRRWSALNGVPSDALEDHVPLRLPARTEDVSPAPEGLDALQRMIAAIPEAERGRYSLPLDLLGRLLHVQ